MKFSVDAEKLQVIKISLQLFNTVTFIARCTTFKWVTNHRFGNVRKHVQQIADTATNISAKTCSFAQQRELGSSTQSCLFFFKCPLFKQKLALTFFKAASTCRRMSNSRRHAIGQWPTWIKSAVWIHCASFHGVPSHNIAVLHCRLTLHTKPHSLTGTQMTKTDHVSSRALKVRMCAGIASFAICPCVASRTATRKREST